MTYGNVNVDTVTTSTPNGILGAGNASIMKNRLINGAMLVAQYGTSSVSNTTANLYTVDRFYITGAVSSKFTAQQNAGSVTPPVGYTKYLGLTSSAATSVGSTDYYFLAQSIEGLNCTDLAWGTANAKTVTLSFQVYSSVTGTYGGSLRNASNNRCYPFTYTISSANTWTSISITIAGDTTGTWATDNSVGINVVWGLGVGSTYSATAGTWTASTIASATGGTNWISTSGATFYITGVQLEVGSSATGFEYVNYQTSLANCQRYYSKQPSTTSGTAFGAGIAISGTQADVYVKLTTSMRAAPTSNTSGCVIEFGTANSVSVSSIANANTGTDSAFLRLTGSAASLTAGQAVTYFGASTSAYVDFSAEL